MALISERAVNFEKWTNSQENYNKAFLKQEKPEEFKMFDFNASTYSKDLKEFAQDYINLHDKDSDKNLNRDEFVSMALAKDDISDIKQNHEFIDLLIRFYDERVATTDKDKDGVWSKDEFLSFLEVDTSKLSEKERKGWDETFASYNSLNLDNDPEHLSAAEVAIVSNYDNPSITNGYNDYKLYEDVSKAFDRLNLDDDNTKISAEEYASELYLSDLDLDTYLQTGNIAASLDGKLDYGTFQTLPLYVDSQKFMDSEKAKFFNEFYTK